MYNYYKDQLAKLKGSNIYPKSIKLFDGDGNSTNQIDLNVESIPVLMEYLLNELNKHLATLKGE